MRSRIKFQNQMKEEISSTTQTRRKKEEKGGLMTSSSVSDPGYSHKSHIQKVKVTAGRAFTNFNGTSEVAKASSKTAVQIDRGLGGCRRSGG